MLAAVVIGFSRTFYLRAFFDVTDRLGSISLPAHLATHGLVLTGWYALLLAQTSLVSLSRVAIHRRLGIVGVVIAPCVIASGADTTFRFIPRALEAGTNLERR